MLTELTIKQLGVIEEATLAPGPGLTVVTGETGAGKTMVVSGLGLVAGARGDASMVRGHQGTALVEARFAEVAPQCVAQVEQAGGQIEEGELLVARQVSAAGRSRSWVGGAAVTWAVARQIGADIVTIHGQSEQVRLSTPARQREVLDRAAGQAMAEELQAYQADFERRQALSDELARLTETARERARESDMLAFGLAEIERIAPVPGEDEALGEEARRLQDADDLRGLAYTAITALAGDDAEPDSQPVLTLVAAARRALDQVVQRDPTAAQLSERAAELAALAGDLAGELSSYLADLTGDPVRLEWIESRLAELKTLTRKYGQDASQVCDWADAAQSRLAELEGSDERIGRLQEEIGSLDSRLLERSGRMTDLRQRTAEDFSRRVAAELAALAMPHARVEFAVTALPQLGPWGADAVALLFTANPGDEPAPLGKVASGGELSRVRLAIEVVLSDVSLGQTFVFDEVDAGIGGAVGLQVGLRLARLARRCQVIAVTHLAQVAAFAGTHYVVTKSQAGEVTASDLSEVTGEARLQELARMMGGLDHSGPAQAHAAELMDQARTMMSH